MYSIGGKFDLVTCFVCGVTIFDWEESDRVALEHRRWSPNCAFNNDVVEKIYATHAADQPRKQQFKTIYGNLGHDETDSVFDISY